VGVVGLYTREAPVEERERGWSGLDSTLGVFRHFHFAMGTCLSCLSPPGTKDEAKGKQEKGKEVQTRKEGHTRPEEVEVKGSTVCEVQDTKNHVSQGSQDERHRHVVHATPNVESLDGTEEDASETETQGKMEEVQDSDDLGREVATSPEDALSLAEEEAKESLMVEILEQQKDREDVALPKRKSKDVGILNGTKVFLDVPKLKRNLPCYIGWSAASVALLCVLRSLSFELLSFLSITLLALVALVRQGEALDDRDALASSAETGGPCETQVQEMEQDQMDACMGTSASEIVQANDTANDQSQNEGLVVEELGADDGEKETEVKREGEADQALDLEENQSMEQSPAPREDGGHDLIIQYERKLAKKVVNHMKQEKDACRNLYKSLDRKDPPVGTLSYDQLRLFFDGLKIDLQPPEIATIVSCIRKKRPGKHDEDISLQETVACLKSYYSSAGES